MGIHGEIVNKLLPRKDVAAAAFIDAKEPHFRAQWYRDRLKQWSKDRLVAFIEDGLTRLNSSTGPRKDYTFTGTELVEAFAWPIRRAFTRQAESSSASSSVGADDYAMAPCTRYIFILDDQKGVPTEKGETQKKRDNARKSAAARAIAAGKATAAASIQPYPKNTVLCDEGVRLPPFPSEPMRLDIRRIMATRWMRRITWEWVLQRIPGSSAFANKPMNAGDILIFEHRKEGPCVLRPSAATGHLELLNGGQPDVAEAHEHGEADLSIRYWADRVCSGHHTVIRTIDSDVLPIMSSFAQTPGKDLIWERRGKGAPAVAGGKPRSEPNRVDLRMLMQCIESRLSMTPRAFRFLCVVCGTDFFSKTWLTHSIGVTAIAAAVRQMSREIDEAWDPKRAVADTEETDSTRKDVLERWLAYLYWTGVPQTKTLFERRDKETATAIAKDRAAAMIAIWKGGPARRVSASASASTSSSTGSAGVKRKRGDLPFDPAQLTLDGTAAGAKTPGNSIPSWGEIYTLFASSLQATTDVAKAKKAAAAKERRLQKKRKRDNDEDGDAEETGDGDAVAMAVEEKKAPRVVTTKYKPPDADAIAAALVKINYNMQYWEAPAVPDENESESDSDSDREKEKDKERKDALHAEEFGAETDAEASENDDEVTEITKQ